jgi:hypothetical protein
MKRSTQVSLVLMTVVGIGAGAYALAPNGDCRQSGPGAPGDAPQGCRSSHGGGSSGHGFYAGSSSSGNSGTSSAADATSRGGFGGTGRGMTGGE